MTFLAARGCVYCVDRGGGGGAYAIGDLSSSGCPPLIITGVQLSDRDLVLPVTTLKNTKIVYVFGHGIGDITVSGNAMLGPSGQGQMAAVINFLRANRVSNSLSTVSVSFPGGGLNMVVAGFGLAPADPEFAIQPFTISGLIASPP